MDGNWRYFDHNPVTGAVRHFLPLEDGKFVLRTVYPVGDLIDQNKEIQTNNLNKKWGDGKVVARVPLNIAFDPKGLGGAIKNKDEAYIRRFINDPDHSYFRTFNGKV